MNKNGFTLVELIAVIVILGLLALIANSSVVNVVKNSKSDLYNTQLKLIESAAETWGNDNLDKLPNDGECKYLTLANLKNYGLMEKEIINPKTNKEFSDDLYIKVTSKMNSSGVLKTTYEVDDSVNGCTEALPPVCTLALDSEKTGFEKGAKYNCKVKETMEVEYPNGYTFYVLGKNEDGTINLIMDRNICDDGSFATSEKTCAVAWNVSGKNADGPVTAMTYLYNATKTWTNVEPLNYIYKDREFQNISIDGMGYTSFISKDGIATITQLTGNSVVIGKEEEPLRARIPSYIPKSEVTNFNAENIYLYQNFDGSYWEYGESTKPINNIPNILGYWLLFSQDNPGRAGIVACSGKVSNELVHADTDFGVRPVITLHNYQLK